MGWALDRPIRPRTHPGVSMDGLSLMDVVNTGGVLVFAAFVGVELRKMRESMSELMSGIAVLLDRVNREDRDG